MRPRFSTAGLLEARAKEGNVDRISRGPSDVAVSSSAPVMTDIALDAGPADRRSGRARRRLIVCGWKWPAFISRVLPAGRPRVRGYPKHHSLTAPRPSATLQHVSRNRPSGR